VQTGFDDPQGGLGNLAFTSNGPSYRVRGVEPSIVARVARGLTVTASASWNSSSQTNSPFLIDDNPKSPTVGQPITSIPNPYGPIGSGLANSPAFQGNVRVRYEWIFNTYNAFWQVAGQHQGASFTSAGYVESYPLPAFTTYDAAVGIGRGSWTVQAFGQNLSNENKSLTTNNAQFIEIQVPLRPRVLGLKFGYSFSDK
jgi:iron complex outermembrane receptor protein